MDEHTTPNRTKWGLAEIKKALEVLPRRDPGVESRLSKEIEGELSLGKKEVPKVRGKRPIYTSQDGKEVGFECSDCLLNMVPAMNI